MLNTKLLKKYFTLLILNYRYIIIHNVVLKIISNIIIINTYADKNNIFIIFKHCNKWVLVKYNEKKILFIIIVYEKLRDYTAFIIDISIII